MARSSTPQLTTGHAYRPPGTASSHSPASQKGTRIAANARCGQSPSSSHPAIAPTAHNSTAVGQCSCILKICPATAMAPPSATVPTACSVIPSARNRSSDSAPPTWNAPTANTSSAIRWKGDISSQCALTNRSPPAASMMPPNATAMITGQRARRRGSCADSNCRMRSACWRSRICASSQRSSDDSSSNLMTLTVIQCSGVATYAAVRNQSLTSIRVLIGHETCTLNAEWHAEYVHDQGCTSRKWGACRMDSVPLVPPYIESLRPYEAGRTIESVRKQYGLTHVAKLGSNENPLGASPKAMEAITRASNGLNRYPNGGLDLREVLAREYDVKVENVIAGSGSEGIMSNIIRAFLCDDDEVLTTDAAFIGFQVLARSRGVKYRTVPYRDWHYDLPALAAQITENTKIIYLANPNNPTGTIFTRQEFDSFYRHVPERVLIILDEAYFEYAQDNPRYPDSMHYRYDNVITLRTFSKIYGLAGVRIGYGFAHEDLDRKSTRLNSSH